MEISAFGFAIIINTMYDEILQKNVNRICPYFLFHFFIFLYVAMPWSYSSFCLFFYWSITSVAV